MVDALYRLGGATAREVATELGEEEAYHSLRVTMTNLWREDLLEREKEGRAYVYTPAVSREEARRSRLSHVLEMLFPESPSLAVRTFLDLKRDELSQEELDEIGSWIDRRAGPGDG